MKIYDGGSDSTETYYNAWTDNYIDILLNEFTGNSLPPTTLSTGNQMFISFTSNGLGKGFSASFAFGKKTGNFNFF